MPEIARPSEASGQAAPAASRIDRAIELCGKYGLRTVLDLHKTQGFSFDAAEGEDGFFTSERYQELFYAVWSCFAARYGATVCELEGPWPIL